MALLKDSSAAFGISETQIREALLDPKAATQLKNAAWHLRAVSYVMEKAKIRFEGADED